MPKNALPLRLPLIAFFGATTISMLGSVLTLIAVPWFVLVTTKSATRMGLTAFCETLAIILAGFFAGTLVDRMGYKQASISTDIASGIAVALVPFLYYTIGLAFWQLLVLVFLSSFFETPGNSARAALLPDVARQAGMPLEQANAFLQAIQRGSRLFGAPLAGILIALLGTSRLLWIDAATFLISAVIIALALPRSSVVPARETTRRYMTELKEGLQFILHDRLLFAIMVIVMFTNFLDAPFLSVIMPVYMRNRFSNAVDFGLAFAAFGGGALVGAVLYSLIGHQLPRRVTFLGAFLLAGLPFWILALSPSLVLTLGAIVFLGVAGAPLNPIINTVNQERVPIGMRGRVFGTAVAGSQLSVPLGTVLAGYLLDLIGIHAVLVTLATCYLIVTSSSFFNSALHEMDVIPATTNTSSAERTEKERMEET
ncbi:MAG: MFS transporter [Ktedonobacteraceae bacterium]